MISPSVMIRAVLAKWASTGLPMRAPGNLEAYKDLARMADQFDDHRCPNGLCESKLEAGQCAHNCEHGNPCRYAQEGGATVANIAGRAELVARGGLLWGFPACGKCWESNHLRHMPK